jgi:hypothetical protein
VPPAIVFSLDELRLSPEALAAWLWGVFAGCLVGGRGPVECAPRIVSPLSLVVLAVAAAGVIAWAVVWAWIEKRQTG